MGRSFQGAHEVGQLLPMLVVLIVTTAVLAVLTPVLGAQQSYVVYLGSGLAADGFPAHQNRLRTLFGSSFAASESIFYTYENFNGFAAKLTPEQAASLQGQEDVVSVFPNKPNILHTTRSWEFLGLEDSFGHVPPSSLWYKSGFGKDVVIGVLDTGVWPESASFSDYGLGPIPASWTGECVSGDEFGPANCNKKLIGGRFFIKGFEAQEGPLNRTSTGDYLSARDLDGHGTHTSSTAGGNFAHNVSTLGFAPGTAKGGAPMARIAMYKVCWPSVEASGGCYDADILAAFDQGISDGVNVFSVSLGSGLPLPPLFSDGIAIGSFHASQHNISVVASAGNSGPGLGTVANIAPWITTVAASSVDRDFPSSVILGNGVSVEGESLSISTLDDKFYPLVSSATSFNWNSNSSSSALCFPGSLDPAKVKGKIVACVRGVTARIDKGQQVKAAGGVGLVLINPLQSGNELVADPHVLPATQLSYLKGQQVFAYINSTKNPVAKLTPATTVLGVKPAPVLTAFSSLGPSSLIPDLLKPDITGPGLNILAAFTEAHSITDLPGDNRIVKYNIISGTSMSCPHVAGITASIKAYHPTWTPAAIHSSIVTTASVYDNNDEKILNASFLPSLPFGVGGGHIAPNRAADPGLVYDSEHVDYLLFLCSLNYTQADIAAISNKKFSCPSTAPTVSDFNYPSLSVSNLVQTRIVTRTVTNVGDPNSSYTVKIDSPPGIKVTISPEILKFSELGEKAVFTVSLTKLQPMDGQYSFGCYTWSDGTHFVRSPLVVQTSAPFQ